MRELTDYFSGIRVIRRSELEIIIIIMFYYAT